MINKDGSFLGGDLNDGFYVGDRCKIEFKFYPSINADGVIFFFPGAYDRSKGSVQFQRHSWHSDYTDKYHCLMLDDPSITTDNELSIGWFQGNSGANLYLDLCGLVRDVCAQLNLSEDRVIFFGSSAGGFVSLKMSEYINEASVIAINPQLFLHEFYENKYRQMLRCCYPNKALAGIEVLVHDVFSITRSDFGRDDSGVVCVFQNKADKFHVENHLRPYLSEACSVSYFNVCNFEDDFPSPNNGLNVYYYLDDVAGHSPPNRKDTRFLITNIAAKFLI
jgi:hypothetical protein